MFKQQIGLTSKNRTLKAKLKTLKQRVGLTSMNRTLKSQAKARIETRS